MRSVPGWGVSLVVVSGAVLFVSGCGTVDSSRFKSFSESSQSIAASTREAYDLLDKVEAERKREKLIASDAPPYSKTNRPLLEGSLHLPSQAIAERLKVTAGLEAYAKALATLAAGPDRQEWDRSVDAAAKALIDFKKDNAATLFSGSAAQAPSDGEIEAFAGAVRVIGGFILDLQHQHALLKVIEGAEPPLDRITQLLADDIGSVNPADETRDGMRGYFYHSVYGTQLVKLSDTNAWAKLDASGKGNVVDASLALVRKRDNVDALLATLRASYLKFAQAHHELEQVARKSEDFSWDNAINTLGDLAQHLIDLSREIQKANP